MYILIVHGQDNINDIVYHQSVFDPDNYDISQQ